MSRTLHPERLTAAAFAPFGEVIEAAAATQAPMNDARFERFHELAEIDVADSGGRPALSVARCLQATTFPHLVTMVERHPHGSQAFVPLSPFVFIVVVAPARPEVDVAALQAFVTDGTQGINYRKGTWHMPMIALEAGQQFLIVDRAPRDDNCDEFLFGEPVHLEAPQ